LVRQCRLTACAQQLGCLIEPVSVAIHQGYELDRDPPPALGGGGRTAAAPPLDAVVAGQHSDDDGQIRSERALPAELPHDRVVVLDQLELDPGREVGGVISGYRMTTADGARDSLDGAEVTQEQRFELLPRRHAAKSTIARTQPTMGRG